jgi:N-acetylglucosaminyldiphosphoundecaprenol N-acetyl-beta-D-mannosaminyltransferase
VEEFVNKPKRISFLNVPVDLVGPDDLYTVIEDYIQNGQRRYIVLLTLDKLLRARVDAEYNRYVREAALVLPVSLAIVKGIRFQKKGIASRYNPYEFIIRLITIAEKFARNVYILGSRIEDLLETEKNLKVSFPHIRVIGRCAGYFGPEKERDIILAVKKSSPALVLLGKGLPGKEKWLFRNIKSMNPGIFVWIDNYIEIFSGTEKSVSKNMFAMGLESFPSIIARPWQFFKIFPYLYFKILVIIYRIFAL